MDQRIEDLRKRLESEAFGTGPDFVPVTDKDLAKRLEAMAAAGDPEAVGIMHHLASNGFTPRFADSVVNAALREFTLTSRLEWNRETQRFEEVRFRKWSGNFPDPRALYAYVLARLHNAGLLENQVVQCQAPAPTVANVPSRGECGNYFFDRPNRKWCSAACGVRVSTRKSKKD